MFKRKMHKNLIQWSHFETMNFPIERRKRYTSQSIRVKGFT